MTVPPVEGRPPFITYEDYRDYGTRPRALPDVVVTMPTPVVIDGLPYLPKYRGTSESAGSARQGPNHLHAQPKPQPTGDGGGGGGPPNAFALWQVADLPDPQQHPGGWYWLGVRTGVDGSAGLPDACTHWPETGGGPAWHSRYPFKPSVVPAHHWLWGGGTVHHPKAVNFNSQFIEHMWLDWGAAQPAPFSWVIAAMVTSYPGHNYTQYLLDAGRNPFDAGISGAYNAADCYTPRPLNDNLSYRTILQATHHKVRASVSARRGLQTTNHADVIPRMFFGVYDGGNSMVGNFTNKSKHLHRGQLATDGDPRRYTVLGRKYGRLSQAAASHLLVFEVRFYRRALSTDELGAVFDHVSSMYKFGRY